MRGCTAVALIYRALKTSRFRRVLFVVDREELGERVLESDTRVHRRLEVPLPVSSRPTIRSAMNLCSRWLIAEGDGGSRGMKSIGQLTFSRYDAGPGCCDRFRRQAAIG